MEFEKLSIPEVLLIKPKVHKDERGFFLESYQTQRYARMGIPFLFVQDNHSKSSKSTLRGLHAQIKYPQGKLLRVVKGEIFDVAVDVRVGSPTFKQWVGAMLSSENFHQLYVPPGFLHGFCVTSDVAEVEYKCTDYYHPEDELSVRWDDPELAIKWGVSSPILSTKDSQAKKFSEILDRLPKYKDATKA